MMSSDSPKIPETGLGSCDGGGSGLDAVLNLLADRRRRYVLYHLWDQEVTTVSDIADRIAGWEGRANDAVCRRVETELHHKHLPRLAEVGVVGRDGETVRLERTPEHLEAFLDLAAERERPL